MINLEFIIEAIVIAFILTLYTSIKNHRLRKKMKKNFNKECYNSIGFVFRKPIITIPLNFVIFFIITLIIKVVYAFIFL